jgi:hypothetical protein
MFALKEKLIIQSKFEFILNIPRLGFRKLNVSPGSNRIYKRFGSLKGGKCTVIAEVLNIKLSLQIEYDT